MTPVFMPEAVPNVICFPKSDVSVQIVIVSIYKVSGSASAILSWMDVCKLYPVARCFKAFLQKLIIIESTVSTTVCVKNSHLNRHAEWCWEIFLTFHIPSLISSNVSLLETLRDCLLTKTQTLISFLWSKWLPELLVKSVWALFFSAVLRANYWVLSGFPKSTL